MATLKVVFISVVKICLIIIIPLCSAQFDLDEDKTITTTGDNSRETIPDSSSSHTLLPGDEQVFFPSTVSDGKTALKEVSDESLQDQNLSGITFDNSKHVNNASVEDSLSGLSRDPDPPICPPHEDIVGNKTRLFRVTEFVSQDNNYTNVRIGDRAECNKGSDIQVKRATVLRVEVDNCCVTQCVHNITIRAAQISSHLVFSFTEFNVPGQGVVTESGKKECHGSLDVFEKFVSDKNNSLTEFNRLGSYCGTKQPSIVYSEHSEAELRLIMFDNAKCIDKINFEVKIVPCTGFTYINKGLELMSNSIVSPGFFTGRNYPNNYFNKWRISVVKGKLIQLIARAFHLGAGDTLSIFPGNENPSMQFPRNITYTNKTFFPTEIVLPSSECRVEFKSDETGTASGFELQFEAVDLASFLPYVDASTLNCSQLVDIPSPIRCNFHVDCADGRDEESCPYRSHTCPKDGYAYEDGCYWIIKEPGLSISSIDAEKYCWEKFSGHLITLNTVKERKIFDKLLKLFKIDFLFIGLKRMSSIETSQLYRRLWMWADGTTAFYLPDEFRFESLNSCSIFSGWYFFSSTCTGEKENITFICEGASIAKNVTLNDIPEQPNYPWSERIDMFHCESGEIISIDRKCDSLQDCYDGSDEQSCDSLAPIGNRMFKCEHYSSNHYLGFSFVCNGVKECSQGEDEEFCTVPRDSFPGDNSVSCQLGLRWRRCDGIRDCPDGSDEANCEVCTEGTIPCPNFYCMPEHWMEDGEFDCPTRDLMKKEDMDSGFMDHIVHNPRPPGIVNPDGYGKASITPLGESHTCPLTHFQCLEGFCIPDYMMCNQHRDCPFGEDEDDSFCKRVCKGKYKCRLSAMCVHYDYVCDGYFHCPFKDDEKQCSSKGRTCPEKCTCIQSEMDCTQVPETTDPLKVHSFDLHHTEIYSLGALKIYPHSLIKLNVSGNRIQSIEKSYFIYPNLIILDLSDNNIEHLHESVFLHSPSLKELILASNNLSNQNNLAFLESTPNLKMLDLSQNSWSTLKDYTFFRANKLEKLILKNMKITKINKYAFNGLEALLYLDLTGNEISRFYSNIFDHNQLLSTIKTDNYRLCCESISPIRVQKNGQCIAPTDEISSCEDMLRSTFLRVSLWTMAILTVVGNLAVIYHRVFAEKGRRPGFRILITSLAFSDLLMGVYLIIIGTADAFLRHRFLSMEERWKESVACQTAGYLCVLSSETSALLILAVTWDRMVAIAFPLRPDLQLTKRYAIAVSVLIWTVALTIATIPLIPPFDSWKLYSQLSVGVPLPITRTKFPGIELSFAVFIQLNMLIFILVVIGQLIIWTSIRKRSEFLQSEIRMKQDMAIAQRLFLVVMTDCLCWIPICVMGLLGKNGVAIPGTVYIVATVFLLPANSALNPLLYTMNAVLQKRRERRQSKSS